MRVVTSSGGLHKKKKGCLAEMERVGSQNRSANVAELSDVGEGALRPG